MNLEDIEKILEKDFESVRERVEKAVEQSPKSVTLEQALEQIKRFGTFYAENKL